MINLREIFEELNEINVIMCPVGGGGLASGTIISTKLYSPKTEVILSEPLNASDAHESFLKKKLIPVVSPNTIADGLKTSLSKRTFEFILSGAKKIITVSEEEIIFAMKLIWERMKIIIEPSCATPLAAILTPEFRKLDNIETVGIILTGGNVDLSHCILW